MHKLGLPNMEEIDERRLKEASEIKRKAAPERTLPEEVAERTKRQVERREAPQLDEK